MPSLLRPHRRSLTLSLTLSLAINLAMLSPSIFMLQVFDRVLVTRSVETLVMLGLLAAITLAAMGGLEQVRSRLLGVIGLQFEQRHGPELLSQLVLSGARSGLAQGYADAMRDLGIVRNFFAGPGIVALFDSPWIIVYIAVIFMFSPALGGLALGCALLLLLLAWLGERQSRAGISEVQTTSREAARFTERCVRNAEVLSALGMTDAVVSRWSGLAERVRMATLAIARRGSALSATTRTMRQLVQVLMLGAGSYLVITQGATPGIMIAITVILGRALAPVEQLIGGWKALLEARSALQRLQAALDRPREGSVQTSLPRPTGQLSVEGVSFVLPGLQKPLLRQVSFSLQPGEMLAIVGPSGSGKTTLARLLVGVLHPSAGSVRLDGADVRRYDPRQLGPAIGYLPQDVELFAGTVADNIARLQQPSSDAVIAAAQAAGAHDTIVHLHGAYDTQVGEGGSSLSGGQRQRVGLARALYGDPSLVVLDEPDASLDGEGEEALVAALGRLRERGAAVVVVTQRRRMLQVADRVLVLKDGAVERLAVRNEATAKNDELAIRPLGQPA